MLESLKQYWYVWLVLPVLIIIAVFAGIKASKAVKKRNEIIRRQTEELKRAKYLTEKYSDLTAELCASSDAKELAEGVTAVLQSELDKSLDPMETYSNAEKWRREVYALFYFDEDCASSLSFFFKHNEKPLPNEAFFGFEDIGLTNIRSLACAMWSMYDDKNESVSLDSGRVDEIDKKFKNIYNQPLFFEKIKLYISENI